MCVYLCIPTYHVFLFCVVRKQTRPPAMYIHQVLSDLRSYLRKHLTEADGRFAQVMASLTVLVIKVECHPQ